MHLLIQAARPLAVCPTMVDSIFIFLLFLLIMIVATLLAFSVRVGPQSLSRAALAIKSAPGAAPSSGAPPGAALASKAPPSVTHGLVTGGNEEELGSFKKRLTNTFMISSYSYPAGLWREIEWIPFGSLNQIRVKLWYDTAKNKFLRKDRDGFTISTKSSFADCYKSLTGVVNTVYRLHFPPGLKAKIDIASAAYVYANTILNRPIIFHTTSRKLLNTIVSNLVGEGGLYAGFSKASLKAWDAGAGNGLISKIEQCLFQVDKCLKYMQTAISMAMQATISTRNAIPEANINIALNGLNAIIRQIKSEAKNAKVGAKAQAFDAKMANTPAGVHAKFNVMIAAAIAVATAMATAAETAATAAANTEAITNAVSAAATTEVAAATAAATASATAVAIALATAKIQVDTSIPDVNKPAAIAAEVATMVAAEIALVTAAVTTIATAAVTAAATTKADTSIPDANKPAAIVAAVRSAVDASVVAEKVQKLDALVLESVYVETEGALLAKEINLLATEAANNVREAAEPTTSEDDVNLAAASAANATKTQVETEINRLANTIAGSDGNMEVALVRAKSQVLSTKIESRAAKNVQAAFVEAQASGLDHAQTQAALTAAGQSVLDSYRKEEARVKKGLTARAKLDIANMINAASIAFAEESAERDYGNSLPEAAALTPSGTAAAALTPEEMAAAKLKADLDATLAHNNANVENAIQATTRAVDAVIAATARTPMWSIKVAHIEGEPSYNWDELWGAFNTGVADFLTQIRAAGDTVASLRFKQNTTRAKMITNYIAPLHDIYVIFKTLSEAQQYLPVSSDSRDVLITKVFECKNKTDLLYASRAFIPFNSLVNDQNVIRESQFDGDDCEESTLMQLKNKANKLVSDSKNPEYQEPILEEYKDPEVSKSAAPPVKVVAKDDTPKDYEITGGGLQIIFGGAPPAPPAPPPPAGGVPLSSLGTGSLKSLEDLLRAENKKAGAAVAVVAAAAAGAPPKCSVCGTAYDEGKMFKYCRYHGWSAPGEKPADSSSTGAPASAEAPAPAPAPAPPPPPPPPPPGKKGSPPAPPATLGSTGTAPGPTGTPPGPTGSPPAPPATLGSTGTAPGPVPGPAPGPAPPGPPPGPASGPIAPSGPTAPLGSVTGAAPLPVIVPPGPFSAAQDAPPTVTYLNNFKDSDRSQKMVFISKGEPSSLPESKPDIDTGKFYLLVVDDLSHNLTPLLNEVGSRLGLTLTPPPGSDRPSAPAARGLLWSLENGGVGNPMRKVSM